MIDDVCYSEITDALCTHRGPTNTDNKNKDDLLTFDPKSFVYNVIVFYYIIEHGQYIFSLQLYIVNYGRELAVKFLTFTGAHEINEINPSEVIICDGMAMDTM